MEENCTSCNWIIGGIGLILLYFISEYYKKTSYNRKLEKWSLLSKEKVILHGIYGGSKTVPSPSPFVLKVETFLRLANIPYEVDKTDPWGPKGKFPWISYKGHHMGDSQFIVEFLEKEFGVKIGRGYSEEQKALATAVRVMLEEHVYWGGVLWRFAYGGKETFTKVLHKELSFGQWLMFAFIASQMKKMAWNHGLGRHTEEEVKHLMMKDIRAISKILGNKKFILGNELSIDDCAIFSVLAAGIFMENSPYNDILNELPGSCGNAMQWLFYVPGECKNIKDYCLCIREELWPDWDEILHKKEK